MTDFDKKLDEIARYANDQLADPPDLYTSDEDIIKSAMLAAIELYAQREPNELVVVIGNITLAEQSRKNYQSAVEIFRAMQAAQLKEIKERIK